MDLKPRFHTRLWPRRCRRPFGFALWNFLHSRASGDRQLWAWCMIAGAGLFAAGLHYFGRPRGILQGFWLWLMSCGFLVSIPLLFGFCVGILGTLIELFSDGGTAKIFVTLKLAGLFAASFLALVFCGSVLNRHERERI